MKRSCETVGFLMVLFGAAGIVHHFVGWFRLFGLLRHVAVFRDHPIGANTTLVALGAVVLVLSDRLPDRAR